MNPAAQSGPALKPQARTSFLVTAAVLLASVALTYYVGSATLQANRQLARQREVSERLERLVSTVKDAETGQRGYLLTCQPSRAKNWAGVLRVKSLFR